MMVEFDLQFNVSTSTRQGFLDFIQKVRGKFEDLHEQLGMRYSHNLPVLPLQQETPTQFFELRMRTNAHSVTFRFRIDNLYLIGYQNESGQWLEFNNSNSQNLIPESDFLRFNGSYPSLANAADRRTEKTQVGPHSLAHAIDQLATSIDGESRARSLIVVIMMIPESIRLNPVLHYMADNFNHFRDTEIPRWMVRLVKNWRTFSGVLLRADACPAVSFRLREPFLQIEGKRNITNIANITEILGILLRRDYDPHGQRRYGRMANDDEGQCFSGVPYLEVFSVRIDNIDGEDPGELYGTITIDNGLYTQRIYNRTSSDYESIKPGQNILLTGPHDPISAFGNFTIELILTDKDTFCWDDEIVHKDISWNASDIGNVYDKLVSKKLDGNNGSVTVNYAVLRNAVAARVVVNVEEGGESTVDVYGQVYAHYDNWKDPNARCLLFDRASGDHVDVKRWQAIPLSRSMVAVPLNSSLKVTAHLYDYDTFSADDVIANGTVEFPAKTTPTICSERISGKDGYCVQVRVDWSFAI